MSVTAHRVVLNGVQVKQVRMPQQQAHHADMYPMPGTPGYTPVRGVDYWTEEDQAAIYAEAVKATSADALRAEQAAAAAEIDAQEAIASANAALGAAEAAASDASGASLAKSAAESARQAAQAAQTAAETARSQAETAKQAAESASQAASADAQTAEQARQAAQAAQTASESARKAAEAAQTLAQTAQQAAQGAQQAAEAAQAAAESARSGADDASAQAAVDALDAEAWATGTRDGTPVSEGDPAYQNNARYYKEQAQAIVGGDYITVSDAQELVAAHNTSEQAHDARFAGKAEATHTHAVADITDFPAIPELPDTMPPSAHSESHAAGGADELTPAAIGAAVKLSGTATLLSSSWQDYMGTMEGDDWLYTNYLAIAGLRGTDRPMLTPLFGNLPANIPALREAWLTAVDSSIRPQCVNGGIMFYAMARPALDIPLYWEVTR